MTDRVDELLDDLTLSEKRQLTHGATDPDQRATGYIPAIERLDIPPLRMVDGPLGVRIPGESSTAFPAPLGLAATFDPDLATEYGRALGRETRGKDQDVLLAPGMNLLRVPHNGRNFEYFSEDPVHAGAFAASVVEGVESMDVVATPKHFVANNQETARAEVSAEVSERALRELYLPAFHDAVAAGAGSVMTAYNRVNGTHMSDHRYLLREILKGEWGFEGFTVSDWFGTKGAAAAANGGLDVEMPGTSREEMVASLDAEGEGPDDPDGGSEAPTDVGDEGFDVPEHLQDGMADAATCERYAETLEELVDSGEVSEDRLDDMAGRVLSEMERHNMFDGDRESGTVDTEEHRDLAATVAARGTVLLQNDGVLPLADDSDVALIGPNVEEAILGGGGSSETSPIVETDPVEGITARSKGAITVEPGLPRVEGISLVDMLTGNANEDEVSEGEVDIEAAADAAAAADVAVVFARDVATEALDRESLALPEQQDELIEAVAQSNDRTVVVLNTSGPVETPWREDVAAILENWYPGQAHGDAIASVLYGDVDPAGRLPVTFAPEGTYPTADERRFPGVDLEAHYDEGVFVGYRHFDATDAEPTFPFGHGQSFATFEYVEATLDDETLAVTVENVADCEGTEVVQAYVRPPEVEGVDRPDRELAGFAAVDLAGGEQATVEIDLDDRAFARYDETDGWTVDSGQYTVEVARSSRDVRLEATTER